MARVGEFCASNVARLLLTVVIIILLVLAVAVWFFYSPGRGSLVKQKGASASRSLQGFPLPEKPWPVVRLVAQEPVRSLPDC